MAQSANSTTSAPPPLSSSEREIWDNLLTADMNGRYWNHFAERYQSYDRTVAVLPIVTAGSAFVAFLSTGYGWLGPVLAVVTAGSAAVRPALQFDRSVQALTRLGSEWETLLLSYEDLWGKLSKLRSCQ
jgi:hypothetical protein